RGQERLRVCALHARRDGRPDAPGPGSLHAQEIKVRCSAPARVRQIPLPPGVEHQEAPEDPLMIPDARDVLENQPTYRGRLEEAYPFDRVEGQALLERSVHSAAHPRTVRYAKAPSPTADE